MLSIEFVLHTLYMYGIADKTQGPEFLHLNAQPMFVHHVLG